MAVELMYNTRLAVSGTSVSQIQEGEHDLLGYSPWAVGLLQLNLAVVEQAGCQYSRPP